MRILVYYYQEALYCTTSNNLPVTFNMYDLLPVLLFQYIEIFSQPWRRSRFRGSGVTEVGDLRPVCWPPVSHLRSNMPVSQAEDTGVGRLIAGGTMFDFIWHLHSFFCELTIIISVKGFCTEKALSFNGSFCQLGTEKYSVHLVKKNLHIYLLNDNLVSMKNYCNNVKI